MASRQTDAQEIRKILERLIDSRSPRISDRGTFVEITLPGGEKIKVDRTGGGGSAKTVNFR